MKTEFAKRSAEVEAYFDFISDDALSADIVPTLKAAAFLLLYNIVESTLTNCITRIFDEMSAREISFDEASTQIRIVALKNIKRREAVKLHPSIKSAATDLLTAAFRADELFSGNLDARKIRETAKAYGFSDATTVKGGQLLTVKETRNDLSHGVKSFTEVGRETTLGDLVRIKAETLAYLNDVVNNVEAYIDNQNYLARPGPTPDEEAGIEELRVSG